VVALWRNEIPVKRRKRAKIRSCILRVVEWSERARGRDGERVRG